MAETKNNNKINECYYSSAVLPPKIPKSYADVVKNSVTAKLDSGASKTYIKPTDASILTNLHNITNGPKVHFPNGNTTTAKQQGNIPLKSLSSPATDALVLPGLTSANLISVGQLCDDGCEVRFNKEAATILKNNKIITTGIRNLRDGLWDILLASTPVQTVPSTTSYQANAIISLEQTKRELLDYLQATLFSPIKSTTLRAILNNNLMSFPGLENIKFVQKYFENNINTLAGHQKQERKNIQSTKTSNTTSTMQQRRNINTNIDIEREFYPQPEYPNRPTHQCFSIVLNFENTTKAYSDLTGQFPAISSRGNKYLFIVYDYDSNAILAEAMPNRQAGTIKAAWDNIHSTLASRGTHPTLYIMDNEASEELKNTMKKKQIHYELVPPRVHRRNAAERAIQTFKDHFIAGLSSVDPAFPISEWDRLLPQAIITLNLLRNSRVNPKLSSYAYLFGHFDFNKTPLAPPGTKVSVLQQADNRPSWSRRNYPAWYVGPAMEHYRCITCFDPATKKEKICDSVKFLPHKIKFPQVSLQDYLRQAATDIVSLLQTPEITTRLSLKYGNPTFNAFRSIAEALV